MEHAQLSTLLIRHVWKRDPAPFVLGAVPAFFMDATDKALAYMSTPAGFGEHVLGFNLYQKQVDIVNEFTDQHSRIKVSTAAPNGSGKSSIIIPTISLRNLCTKPQGRVIITSKDSRQLDEQVWPALEAHRGKFPRFEWKQRQIITPQGGFALGFTTDDAARAEGWHSKIDEALGIDSPVTIICDEAKSIPEPIFEAFSGRCTFNQLHYISSTGLMSGAFFRSQNDHKAGFKRYIITFDDCKHILKQERIDALFEEYPPDDPFLRSTLFAEFMNFDGDFGSFTSLAAIQKCLASPPRPMAGETVAFCDFAGGGAENVLAVRRGNKVTLVRCWREVNEMVAVGEFITLFRDEALRPDQIWGDNAGAGKPIIARFHELGWPINRFNGGAEAQRPSDFVNRVAEICEMSGREISRGKVDLPNDAKLHEQLTTRKRGATPDGRIKAESKEDMAKRGLKSPDRADAVNAVIAIKPFAMNTKADAMPSWMEAIEENYQDQLFERVNILGADAGL